MVQPIAFHPAWWALFCFFVLGWSYYMTATILMRGSIFISLRTYIARRAEKRSRFFMKVQEMLGCLMCTATQAALWTLGISTLIFGLRVRALHALARAFFPGFDLPFIAEVVLMAMVSFALSLAVAGEAWAIRSVVEHNEDMVRGIKAEFQKRENTLLSRIAELEALATGANEEYEYDFNLEENK